MGKILSSVLICTSMAATSAFAQSAITPPPAPVVAGTTGMGTVVGGVTLGTAVAVGGGVLVLAAAAGGGGGSTNGGGTTATTGTTGTR